MSGSILPESFWGPATATIDWCDPNYRLSRFIAEPINTFSNLSFILLGITGAIYEFLHHSKRSFVILHSNIALIGIGSALFHGTLKGWAQQSDELPMVWHLLACIYCINEEQLKKSKIAHQLVVFALAVYAVVFSVFHYIFKTTTFFQVHYVALLLATLRSIYLRFRTVDIDPETKLVINSFFYSIAAGGSFWLLDYHGCKWIREHLPFNPQGHMLWHLFMGYGAFCSVAMIKILESKQMGMPYKVSYYFGLPFVANEEPVVQDTNAANWARPILQVVARPNTVKELF